MASQMGRLLTWCPYVKRRLEEIGDARPLLLQDTGLEGVVAEDRTTGLRARLRLRTILLLAGIALCLVGAFLHDPRPLWGDGDLEITAGLVLMLGVIVTLAAIAMVSWRRIDLTPCKVMLVGSLVLILVGFYLFDPRQGYRRGLNLFIDGNLWSLVILCAGTGLLALEVSLGRRAWRKGLALIGVILILALGIILGTRVTKEYAIEKGLEYFSDLENPVLVGAWFGLERPSGSTKGFKTMSGRDPVIRPVWKIAIMHDALFGSVWLAPWSGEIIAVDGPEKWIR